MKKIKFILITLFTLFFTSCEKEQFSDCNCGTVANDGVDTNCYWLEIRNECTGNKKKFCFDQDVWMDFYPGDYICVTNANKW